MPTTRRRMALTPPDELIAALADLADAVGKPPATVATELLMEAVPQMHDLAKIARLTKTGQKAAAKRALVHMLGDGMAEIVAAQQPDMFKSGKRPR